MKTEMRLIHGGCSLWPFAECPAHGALAVAVILGMAHTGQSKAHDWMEA